MLGLRLGSLCMHMVVHSYGVILQKALVKDFTLLLFVEDDCTAEENVKGG